ncbi:type I restriction endonuclease subunit R [Crenobacter cavernae]|uniref:Type I restriction endonuclease subunit R n=1 Tax=Crenobacter cavernae TaxID=2290923 RepID=A0ABY0FCN5_9NEIS|nr:DEAD/DEAH box helicase family protein [Crenobacter cavernae]RXZ42210.1 type I restriction endonuclease subunit R [Crenobacter cavernae]
MHNAHLEKIFQHHIVDRLREQGWKVGRGGDYDAARALLPAEACRWLRESQPEKWDKLERAQKANTETWALKQLVRELETHGTLDVLRRGFSVTGAGRLAMSQNLPEDGRNELVLHRYACNRLTVIPELTYNPDSGARLDLAFFINGLPVATAELKSDFTQSLDDAIAQYRTQRPLRCPHTGREEPLLKFKRGALVHFAATQNDIAMSTRLDGEKTRFLPFNQGHNDGAGNPPGSDDRYAVAYWWEEILQPDTWLRIFHRFMLYKRETKEDARGRPYISESMVFPRYHQWQAVTDLVDQIRADGVGQRYLIEHSAGSGKTHSIAWTCHELIRLRETDGTKFFDTVIVITDRTVLDAQLQDAIRQIDHQQGVVKAVDRENSPLPKSRQLADALLHGTPIVVVTLQTFPHAMEAILAETSLKHRRFAVVVDEAHTSQLGASATKLRAALSLDANDTQGKSTEELLERLQGARGFQKNLSYFAFTATPKHSTFSLFGRLPRPDEPAGEDNVPLSFHRYTMKQAIEEGFILDVLKNYVSYKTAFRLGNDMLKDERVDSKQAKRALARWLSLHPTNVTQKVEMIVEHFRRSVAHLLNHQAKAMIVTGSRAQAVAYKLAFERYTEKHGYGGLCAMVAFSGDVDGNDVIGEFEDDARHAEWCRPFADQTFDEINLNPRLKGDMRRAFDRPDWQVMIVANKFQTGFDQPKLVAMYVDKKLSGVEAVQTLSRLNRTYPGKDRTFVIDFANEPDEILAAFRLYHQGAVIEDVQDPNVIYQTRTVLEQPGLYFADEVETFGKELVRLPSPRQTKLEALITPAAHRFNEKLKALNDAVRQWESKADDCKARGDAQGEQRAELERAEQARNRDALLLFKGNLSKFVRQYEYIAQLMELGYPELEALSGFARLLAKKLAGVSPEDVDLAGLQMTHFKLYETGAMDHPLGTPVAREDAPTLRPLTGAGTREPKDKLRNFLSELVERLNELFGDGISDENKLGFAVMQVGQTLRANERVMRQIEHNDKALAVQGELKTAAIKAILAARNGNQAMADQLLSGDDRLIDFLGLMYDLLKHGQDLGLARPPAEH